MGSAVCRGSTAQCVDDGEVLHNRTVTPRRQVPLMGKSSTLQTKMVLLPPVCLAPSTSGSHRNTAPQIHKTHLLMLEWMGKSLLKL